MRLAAALAAVLALAALQAQAISRCTDAQGKVSYIEGACPPGSKQEKLTVSPPPQAAHPAPAGSPGRPAQGPGRTGSTRSTGLLPAIQDGPDPHMDALVRRLATYQGCEGASPALARSIRPGYEEWHAQNAALLERLPHSQRYMKALSLERFRASSQLGRPETRKEFLDNCQALAQAAATQR
jgi:hypothetical protein